MLGPPGDCRTSITVAATRRPSGFTRSPIFMSVSSVRKLALFALRDAMIWSRVDCSRLSLTGSPLSKHGGQLPGRCCVFLGYRWRAGGGL